MKKYGKILRFDGILLSLAGLAHIVYMGWFATTTLTEPAAIGGMLFGVLYLFFGLIMMAGISKLILITLIINTLGLTTVLIARENSPLWEIDPYLIVVDLISVPVLVWLNLNKKQNK